VTPTADALRKARPGLDPTADLAEYFELPHDERSMPRGGFGIGGEWFVAFAIGSNDNLDTVPNRTLQP
jgi:hypothetical protein